jgi:hypothetical protein
MYVNLKLALMHMVKSRVISCVDVSLKSFTPKLIFLALKIPKE